MNVIQCLIWHVPWHPDSAGCHDIKVVFQFGRELIRASAQEEIVVFLVKTALANCIQEVGRHVKRMQVLKACILESLTDDARSGTDIHHDGAAVELQTTLVGAFSALIDDVLRLGEIDDAGPLVVAFGRETSVPLSDVLLLGQVVVELVNDESAFFRLRFGSVRLLGSLFDDLIFGANFVLFNELLLQHCFK